MYKKRDEYLYETSRSDDQTATNNWTAAIRSLLI